MCQILVVILSRQWSNQTQNVCVTWRAIKAVIKLGSMWLRPKNCLEDVDCMSIHSPALLAAIILPIPRTQLIILQAFSCCLLGAWLWPQLCPSLLSFCDPRQQNTYFSPECSRKGNVQAESSVLTWSSCLLSYIYNLHIFQFWRNDKTLFNSSSSSSLNSPEQISKPSFIVFKIEMECEKPYTLKV